METAVTTCIMVEAMHTLSTMRLAMVKIRRAITRVRGTFVTLVVRVTMDAATKVTIQERGGSRITMVLVVDLFTSVRGLRMMMMMTLITIIRGGHVMITCTENMRFACLMMQGVALVSAMATAVAAMRRARGLCCACDGASHQACEQRMTLSSW